MTRCLTPSPGHHHLGGQWKACRDMCAMGGQNCLHRDIAQCRDQAQLKLRMQMCLRFLDENYLSSTASTLCSGTKILKPDCDVENVIETESVFGWIGVAQTILLGQEDF